MTVELLRYRSEDGHEPFTEWILGLSDRSAQARIRIRLRKIEVGNFGDSAPVGDGVIELRIHIGGGYRVYCAKRGDSIVLLLCGGSKASQRTDIQWARRLWSNWKEGQR